MSFVSRNDIYVRSEKGPSWFEEFLRSMAEQQPSTVQDIMSTISDKKAETVESVVSKYREQVGLDSLADESIEEIQIKTASFKPLSIRHASMGETKSIVSDLDNNPELLKAIDSLCQHSGGTKSTVAILSKLRDNFGKELVSFSDGDLKEYIEGRKAKFKVPTEDDTIDLGLLEQDYREEFDDEIADYQKHDGVKR